MRRHYVAWSHYSKVAGILKFQKAETRASVYDVVAVVELALPGDAKAELLAALSEHRHHLYK